LATPSTSAFRPLPQPLSPLDPEIKREAIWHGLVLRPAALLGDRHNQVVRVREEDGSWSRTYPIRPYDSDDSALGAAIDLAFPGSQLTIECGSSGRFELFLRQHGLLRALSAAELSDGTLRYLLWIAALLSPRPSTLLVLNEPENSLHADLLAPLAMLISDASAKSQVIAVSHSPALTDALRRAADGRAAPLHAIELTKDYGETRIAGQEPLDQPAWHWPKR
jgi:predicted ATPase